MNTTQTAFADSGSSVSYFDKYVFKQPKLNVLSTCTMSVTRIHGSENKESREMLLSFKSKQEPEMQTESLLLFMQSKILIGR